MDSNQAQLAAAIDWLVEAVEASPEETAPRRLSPKEHSEADGVVDQIIEMIHPLQLPSDIEWFWRTWDSSSFGSSTGHPRLTAPAFALEAWLEDPEWPRALFWVAYESHCFMAIELEYPDSHPSLLFEDCYASGQGLRLVAPNLATWISACAADIEAHPQHQLSELWSVIGDGDAKRRCGDALSANSVDVSERGPFEWEDMLAWPERWQAQQAVDAGKVALKGATHTVAELVEARGNGPVVATLRGQVSFLGSEILGELAVVEDDTGRAEFWIPATVPNLGWGSGALCELDVNADVNKVSEPTSAYLEGGHPIVATEIRPVT